MMDDDSEDAFEDYEDAFLDQLIQVELTHLSSLFYRRLNVSRSQRHGREQVDELGKLRITKLPLMLKAATSCALASISGVGNVPSHIRHFLRGIKDIKITKKSWVFPWQSCTLLDVSPVNYTFEVQAMSAEKLPFLLPAVFTIGLKADEAESLLKYARLLSAHDQHSNHVNDLVWGVIEGEKRVLLLAKGAFC